MGMFPAALDNLLWIPVKPNVTVAAHGVVVPNGVATDTLTGGQIVFLAKQANTNSPPVCYVNGPIQCSASKVGRFLLAGDTPVLATYSGNAPSVGDALGLASGSTSLSKGKSGFYAVGAGASGKVWVVRAGGGGGLARATLSATMNANATVNATDIDTAEVYAVTDFLLNTGNLAANTTVSVAEIAGTKYVVSAKCQS